MYSTSVNQHIAMRIYQSLAKKITKKKARIKSRSVNLWRWDIHVDRKRVSKYHYRAPKDKCCCVAHALDSPRNYVVHSKKFLYFCGLMQESTVGYTTLPWTGLDGGLAKKKEMIGCFVTHSAPTHFWEWHVRILIPCFEASLFTRTKERGSSGVRLVQFMYLWPPIACMDGTGGCYIYITKWQTRSGTNCKPDNILVMNGDLRGFSGARRNSNDRLDGGVCNCLMGKLILWGGSSLNQYSSSPVGSSMFTKTMKCRSLSRWSMVVVPLVRSAGQST